MPKSKLGSCIDSGASEFYCPDQEKFANYKQINQSITTANGRKLKAIGMGDLEIDLLNGSKVMKTMFKDAIHTPDMAFTLIVISKLDKAKYKVVFHKSTCTIINPKGKTIAMIPHSEGLYRISSAKSAENGGVRG